LSTKTGRVFLALIVTLLIFLGTIRTEINTVANPTPWLPNMPTTIYIRENGAIEGEEGALQCKGNTYTFLRDIERPIEIQRNNTVLDGNGFTLTLPPEDAHISLGPSSGWFSSVIIENKSNILVENINFSHCCTAISIKHSTNITVLNNEVSQGLIGGFYVHFSNYCQIIGNRISNSSWEGLRISFSNYLNIANNIISDQYDQMNWDDVSYSNVTRNSFFGYDSTDRHSNGIRLYGYINYNRVMENNFVGNRYGVNYEFCDYFFCHDNEVANNYWRNTENLAYTGDIFNWTDQSPAKNSYAFNSEKITITPTTLQPNFSPKDLAIIVGVAIAGTVIAAVAITIIHFRRNPTKVAKSA
jgi:parallel beta-helix repeat protein